MNSVIYKNVKYKSLGLINYEESWKKQESIFNKIIDTKIKNRNLKKEIKTDNYILSCSHPHVYTLGKSGDEKNLLIDKNIIEKENLEFFKINRGGDITYHGPGQIVIYPILDLENFFTDIHKYLRSLEEAVILTLKEYNIESGRIKNYTGVWIDIESDTPRKICALGVKTSRWVTMHGFSLNVQPDLNNFKYIIPCGISDKGITSISDMKKETINISDLKLNLIENFARNFKAEIEKND